MDSIKKAEKVETKINESGIKEETGKEAECQKLKRAELKLLPSPYYACAMNNQQKRFDDIKRENPEWEEYVNFGFFSVPNDNLGHMDLDQYKKIWEYSQKNADYLDAFLHLKRAFKIKGIGIGKEEKNKVKNWSLNDFRIWANKFIEVEEKKSLPVFSLQDLWGLEGFYEVNIQIKALEKTDFLRNVDLFEFLVSDGECKAILIIPPEMGMDIGHEYIIKKCDIFWNKDDGCPFLHLYAPIFIEKAADNKIEIVEIDDLHYPKWEWEIEPDEIESNINSMELDEEDSNVMDD